MVFATAVAGGGGIRGGLGFSTDPRDHHQPQKGAAMGMENSAMLGSLGASAAAAEETSSEDPNKKIRKPYTITKSRESWTDQEHDKFLEALQLFDRDWKKIEAFVGSKTVIQIRSHAQKYFLKVQKNGTSEHVPPPRPKRKAAHPYPQKASKNGNHVSQHTTPFQTNLCLLEPGFALRSDTASVNRNSTTNGTISSWVQDSNQTIDTSQTRQVNFAEDVGPAGAMLPNNSCSSGSTENLQSTWQNCEPADQGHFIPSVRAMPDFAQVYSFIGGIFDPSTSGHLQKLKEMNPIDVETVLLLMRNLSINLSNPDFEGHRRVLLSYDASVEEGKSGSPMGMLEAGETLNVPFLVKSEQ